MRFSIDIPLTQKHLVRAWSFLEDAEAVTKQDSSPYQMLLHIERYLASAAVALRSACEAKFGSWKNVPDSELMWFVTKARHMTAHAEPEAGHSNTNATNVEIRWSEKQQSGSIEARVYLTFDPGEPTNTNRQAHDAAVRYLLRHNDDFFQALHAATQQVANWCGIETDEDFRQLATQGIGHAKITIPIDAVQYKQLLTMAKTRTGIINLGPMGPDKPHSTRHKA